MKTFFEDKAYIIECNGNCEPKNRGDHQILCAHCHHDEIVALSCLGVTQRDKRCRRTDLDEHGFCRAHTDQAVPYSNRLSNLYLPKIDGWGGLFSEFGRAIRDEALLDIEQSVRNELRVLHLSLLDMFDERSKYCEKIYFIRAGNLVKIGRSVNPGERLKALRSDKKQTIIPKEVDMSEAELIAVFPGGRRVESRLHFEFRRHRVAGEWFRLTREVREFALNRAAGYEQELREMAARI